MGIEVFGPDLSPLLIKIGSTIRLSRRIRELRNEYQGADLWQLMGVIACSSEPECRLLEQATLAAMPRSSRAGGCRELFRVPTVDDFMGRCDA